MPAVFLCLKRTLRPPRADSPARRRPRRSRHRTTPRAAPRLEVVDADRIQRHRAQLLELRALVRGDPAFAHALVQLRSELKRFDVVLLERLEELAFHRFG